MCKNIPFPINYRRTSKLNILSGVSDKSSNTLQIHWKFSFFFFFLFSSRSSTLWNLLKVFQRKVVHTVSLITRGTSGVLYFDIFSPFSLSLLFVFRTFPIISARDSRETYSFVEACYEPWAIIHRFLIAFCPLSK